MVDEWWSCLDAPDTDRSEFVQNIMPLFGCSQMDEPNMRTASNVAGITSNTGK